MKWFKHDANAHRDVKLKKLIMRYGIQGYGLYFYCLERITDGIDINNLTFKLEDDAEIMAHDLGMHVDDVQAMMIYMVELGLFEDSSGVITCLKLAKRLDQSMTSSSKFRSAIQKIHDNHDGVMTPSGLSHDTVMQEEKRKEEEEKRKEKPSSGHKGVTTRSRVPFSDIQNLWNEMMPELPKCEKLTSMRKSQIRARWNDGLPDIESWREFFEYIRGSKFLMGKSQSNGRKPFRATLEWVTKESNYAKIYEDNYHG
jgi:hypothetical protein